MTKSNRVSEAVIRRLPRYLRHLVSLNEQGVVRISSSELAKRMRLNASQIRQDFNCFGGFGQQGYGYHVPTLCDEVKRIITRSTERSAVVVGAGHIGQALCNFKGFAGQCVFIKALFDVRPELIGQEINGKPVLNVSQLQSYIKDMRIDIGILTTTRAPAQGLVDQMVEAGVKGIWNFAPLDITASVPVEDVHMSDNLAVLVFRIGQQE